MKRLFQKSLHIIKATSSPSSFDDSDSCDRRAHDVVALCVHLCRRGTSLSIRVALAYPRVLDRCVPEHIPHSLETALRPIDVCSSVVVGEKPGKKVEDYFLGQQVRRAENRLRSP